MQKYNIRNPDEILDPVITKFVQIEKLNDTDLKRLDIKIQKLIKDKSAKDLLKSKLTHELQDIDLTQNSLQTEIEPGNKNSLSPDMPNTIDNDKTLNNIQKKNEFPSINPLNTYTNANCKNDHILKNRGNSSYSLRGRKNNYFKPLEEELAELEKELEEDESKKRKNYTRIDFTKDGDEWSAIVKYNKKLFDMQVLDERLKDKAQKKRNKYYLDLQVKEKIKKEYEDELKDKEYDKIMQEHSRKLDEMEEK